MHGKSKRNFKFIAKINEFQVNKQSTYNDANIFVASFTLIHHVSISPICTVGTTTASPYISKSGKAVKNVMEGVKRKCGKCKWQQIITIKPQIVSFVTQNHQACLGFVLA